MQLILSLPFRVATGAIYKWRENYELYGESGLMRKGKETIIQEADYKRLKRENDQLKFCLLYTSPSPRDLSTSRMPSSA